MRIMHILQQKSFWSVLTVNLTISDNTTMKPIGIYVHHHSDGHRQRAIAIAKQAPDYFTLLGSGLKGKTGALSIVDLPEDSFSSTDGPAEGNHMCQNLAASHGASGGHAILRRRPRLIAEWIEATEPALLLIDACVEIATLARLTSTPTAYVRLSGNRTDPTHLEAFRAAEAILCPFHKVLESENTPKWLCERSHYFPGLTNAVKYGSAMAALHDEYGATRATKLLLDIAYGAKRFYRNRFANAEKAKLAFA